MPCCWAFPALPPPHTHTHTLSNSCLLYLCSSLFVPVNLCFLGHPVLSLCGSLSLLYFYLSSYLFGQTAWQLITHHYCLSRSLFLLPYKSLNFYPSLAVSLPLSGLAQLIRNILKNHRALPVAQDREGCLESFPRKSSIMCCAKCVTLQIKGNKLFILLKPNKILSNIIIIPTWPIFFLVDIGNEIGMRKPFNQESHFFW